MAGNKKGLPTTFKHCELVIYEDSWSVPEGQTFPEWINSLLRSRWFEYAMIRHDRDKGKKIHWHVMLRFKTPWKTGDILSKFCVASNQISRIKGKFGDGLSYLTHANEPDKFQYDPSDVYSNFEWEEERHIGITERLHRCSNGEIRQYNYTDYFSDSEYLKYERKIKQAFKYRSDYVMQHLEEQVEKRNVVWIYGPAGTGKTTLAKGVAKGFKFAYRITSTGKNMFDEYKDEPCLIIDDLRPNDCGFADLLGILDPFNSRAINSRYVNKANQAELVIITCPYSPVEFYEKCGIQEPPEQLYRRINTLYHVTEEFAIEYTWNGIQWVEGARHKNLFYLEAKKKARKSTEVSNVVSQVFQDFAEQGF